MPEFSIESGDTEVVIGTRGGAVCRYVTSLSGETHHWLVRPAAEEAASFPLVPFCSRIRGGKFSFGSHLVRLPANNPPEVHAIHGHGFQREWELVERTARRAVLRYRHGSGAWPWAYEVRQTFALNGRDLSMRLELLNCSDEPMPYGLGFHPHFAKTAAMTIKAGVQGLWQLDDQLMTIGEAEAPEKLSLPSGFSLADSMLDHVFQGWDGSAVVCWPERRSELRITGGGCINNLVLYAPAGGHFVCVEPISNVPDGFNLAPAAFKSPVFELLAPGGMGTMSLLLQPQLLGQSISSDLG